MLRYATANIVLLLPGVLVFAVMFVLPLGFLGAMSFFAYSRMTGISTEMSLVNYANILADPYYLDLLRRTMRLALLTSVFTMLAGYPVALYLSIAPERARGWIILFILSPLLISVIVRSFGWLIILGPNGLTDSLFRALGLGSGAVLHSEMAVVIGLVNVLMPFFVLSVATSLQSIDPDVPRAASSLGASPWQVFLKITVPLSIPGILSGLLIVFSLASSSFVTPALLGGASYRVLSTMIYEQAMVLQNWPMAAALAIILVAAVLLILFAQNVFVQRSKYKVVLG